METLDHTSTVQCMASSCTVQALQTRTAGPCLALQRPIDTQQSPHTWQATVQSRRCWMMCRYTAIGRPWMQSGCAPCGPRTAVGRLRLDRRRGRGAPRLLARRLVCRLWHKGPWMSPQVDPAGFMHNEQRAVLVSYYSTVRGDSIGKGGRQGVLLVTSSLMSHASVGLGGLHGDSRRLPGDAASITRWASLL